MPFDLIFTKGNHYCDRLECELILAHGEKPIDMLKDL
jgi:hypothetical protein